MSKLYKLGWLNPPNKLIQKSRKLSPDDDFWDVATEKKGFDNNETRKVEFVRAFCVGWHSDYEAWTHILVLQCDGHRIGVKDYCEESFYPIKRGDIIKFDIDSSHCLECLNSSQKPFLGLAYDAFHGSGHNLNSFTAVPFFRALIHNMDI